MLRNFLLILLVVLLPIRSWATDRMGLKMAQPTLAVQTMSDSDASHCEMMLFDSTKSNSQTEHHDNPICQACSLCMAFAFAGPEMPMNTNDYSHQWTVRDVLSIDSALLALPLKPPIF